MCAIFPSPGPARNVAKVDLTRSPHRLAMTAICALRPSPVAASDHRNPPFAMFRGRLDQCPLRAVSAPRRIASGRTGVRAKAAIPLRARKSLHHPKRVFRFHLDRGAEPRRTGPLSRAIWRALAQSGLSQASGLGQYEHEQPMLRPPRIDAEKSSVRRRDSGVGIRVGRAKAADLLSPPSRYRRNAISNP